MLEPSLAAFFSFCASFFCLLDLGGAFCTFFCSLFATIKFLLILLILLHGPWLTRVHILIVLYQILARGRSSGCTPHGQLNCSCKHLSSKLASACVIMRRTLPISIGLRN